MNEADRATAQRHQAIREEFQRCPAVSAHAGRPLLPPEATASFGFVIAVDDAEVARSTRRAISPLEADGCLSAFPPDYLHITLVPPVFVGPAIPGPDAPPLKPEPFVQKALERARSAVRGQSAFEVTVRGLNAFRDVLVAVPYDGGRGLKLGGAIRAAVPDLPELYPDGHDLLPHISLGRYVREDQLEPLRDTVKRERETEFGRFRVRRLGLYVLQRGEGEEVHVEKHQLALGEP